ncbi:MAG: family 16 glycosylhydrolase, partial [Clostridia bacterium]|nr:family 16 glycosylhydrolase [Clostridia bacterium]
MKTFFWRVLALTAVLPLLSACAGSPTGDASSALASSKAGGASVTETSADASLTGDASETATSPADASEETSSGAAISALSSLTSSKASSATSSKTSSATSSKTSSATSSRTSSISASSQAVSSVYTPPADTRVINSITYQLTFKDEFDGTSLNSTYWYCCPEGPRQDVGGRWADSMVSVHDGCLYLGAAIDSNGTPISGAVRTMNKWYQVKWSQCKGYFECRAKLQSAPGFWGAFWLMSNQNMGNNNNTNGAKDGAEIDIMESFSVTQGGVNHAIHWDGYGDNHKSTGKS